MNLGEVLERYEERGYEFEKIYDSLTPLKLTKNNDLYSYYANDNYNILTSRLLN